MKDLQLDPVTHDLAIINFDLALADGIDQIAQNLGIRLRFILGEWYLDQNAGMPYFEYFFVKSPNQINVEASIKNEIVNTIGVNEITSFASQYNNSTRRYSVQFTANTEFGQLNLSEQIP